MHESHISILEKSTWFTATPTASIATLPFYVTEAGCFYARKDYYTKRSDNDSYLFLYTLSGKGKIETENRSISLPPGTAILVDCRNYHYYFSDDNHWNFLWMHIKGNGITALYDFLYPNGICSVLLPDELQLKQLYANITEQMLRNDFVTASKSSSELHAILHMFLSASYFEPEAALDMPQELVLHRALEFITKNYGRQISIDEIADAAHVSKYYFIRLFKRYMGVTPYHYLISFRINQSKLLLRNTSDSITDIALQCGFLDDSNFIAQFKKHTGEKPTKYRKDFS